MSRMKGTDATTWSHRWRGALATVAVLASAAGPVFAEGYEVMKASLSSSSVTGEKPQSKIFYHDGSYWAILKGASGVAFYEFTNGKWSICRFMDAIVTTSGAADIVSDGPRLHVLVYSSYPKYFEYTYDTPLRVWKLTSGFPVSVPKPSNSETMVLAKDSTGRLWTTAEGGGKINVYYTTSADHRTWSPTPVILQSGVYADDISSIIAFGGNRIGVLWSDQIRDEFGFRIHHDGADPTVWEAKEIADSGPGHADDHMNLKADADGRVYAITKDAFDHMTVHRRDTSGTWTEQVDVLEGIGTRGILMLSESEHRAYILYTRWGVTPDRIEYRYADMDELLFGSTTIFMRSTSSLNNVTGMKQNLPSGSLMAMSEGASRVWWNGWGNPPAEDDSITALRPRDLVANLEPHLPPVPSRVTLSWTPPSSMPDSATYNVYRMVNTGVYQKINADAVAMPSYVDSNLVMGELCYRVTTRLEEEDDDESGPSNSVCLEFFSIPGAPLPPPRDVTVESVAATSEGAANGAAAYLMDEGSGQLLADATGLGHMATLGNTSGTESFDPLWATGVTGSALRFNGMVDRVRIAHAADLNMAGSFTVEGWIQRPRPDASSTGCIVAKGDVGRRNYSLQIDSSSRVEFRWQTAGAIDHGAVTTAKITDTSWHHIAAVYDQAAGQDRVYIDGKLVKSQTDSGTPITNSDPVYIGARASGNSIKNFFSGSIDLVRISPAAIYNADFAPPTAYGTGAAQLAVQLTWNPPYGLPPTGYNIYAEYNGAPGVKLNGAPIATLSYTDIEAPLGTSCYRLASVDSTGLEGALTAAVCTSNALGKSQSAASPSSPAPALAVSITPNPFNPDTNIRFQLAAPAPVFLAIYNVRGQKVATLVDGTMSAGEHQVRWAGRLDDGATASSGVYFLRLRAAGDEARRKLILLK